MKKAFLGILATAIVLSVCAATAFAAGPGGRRYFVDADGDGICDNSGANHGSCLTGGGMAFTDTDGDGICDNRGMAGACCGRNFVDADGDGACDNYVTGQGRGNGHGNGFRGGCGR